MPRCRRFIFVVRCSILTVVLASCTTSARSSVDGTGTPSAASGTPSTSDLERAVDSYLAPVVAARDFAGAVLVARGDRILFEKGYGLANAELGIANTPTIAFRIASITKTFTAAAIGHLVDRGVLRYADTLSRFLPDFPGGDRITIEQLLLHRSGVANPNYEALATSRVTLAQLVAHIGQRPPLFAPGTRTQYSNAGYVILAAVVERASGMPYDTFIRLRVAEPLGLRGTRPDHQEAIVAGRASGYVPGPPPSGLSNVSWYDMSPLAGSGRLLSNVRDLHRWAQAVHRDEVYRRSALRYPYGWGVRKYYGRDMIEQSGTIDGFTSYLGLFFRDSIYVVCLTNVEAALNERCGKDIAAMAFGETYQPLPPTPPAVARAAVAPSDTGRYASPDIGAFRVFLADGEPYVQWATARTPHYAVPIGRDSLFVRADRSVITLDRDTSRDVREVRRSWGGGQPARFTRESRP